MSGVILRGELGEYFAEEAEERRSGLGKKGTLAAQASWVRKGS
jgi:hypothetical protein